MKVVFAVCAAVLALAACADGQPVAQVDEATPLTVAVDPVAEPAPVLEQHAPTPTAPGVPPQTPAALVDYMQHNDIAVGRIVHRVFVHQLGLHAAYRARVAAHGGAAQFKLHATWGLYQESFGMLYRPQLIIDADLVANGRVIWHNSAALTPQTGGVGGRTWAELFASPAVLQAMLSSAARQVVARLLMDM
jgi:hypothetical protein